MRNQLAELSSTINVKGVEFLWMAPTQEDKGIFTTNVCFSLAKELKESPAEMSKRLSKELNDKKDGFKALSTVEFAAEGPFINVYLSVEGIRQTLSATQPSLTLPQDDRKVMFEYIGANVAKRLHIGHMRNINIGEALRRILLQKYPNLITDNHWGDWGVQFGVLLWAYKQQLNEDAYAADPMSELQRLYVWGNQQENELDNWAETVRSEFKKLEDGDEENMQLWNKFLQVSKQELQQDLKLLHVPETDLEQGESYYEDWMDQLIEFCDEHELWVVDGQARYVDFEQLAEQWNSIDEQTHKFVARQGRAYFVSSQGYTTYVFRDVAARLQWSVEHEIDLAVTLTDNRQQHNFNQAFSFISYLADQTEFKDRWGESAAQRLTLDRLRHVGYGYISLTSGALSSRTGNTLLLRDAFRAIVDSVKMEFEQRQLPYTDDKLEAISLAALKWKDLKTDRNTDITINPDEIVSFEGDTGVYQLYTLVRLNGILSNSDLIDEKIDPSQLNDSERRLLERTVALQGELEVVTQGYNPAQYVSAIGGLSRSINKWYEENRVADEPDPNRKATMLQLVKSIRQTLAVSLELLGMPTVDEI